MTAPKYLIIVLITITLLLTFISPASADYVYLGIDSSYLHSSTGISNLGNALDGTAVADMWSTSAYFIISLGDTYSVSKVRIRTNSSDDPTTINIYYSCSTSGWTLLETIHPMGLGSWEQFSFTARWCRYLKFTVTTSEVGDAACDWGTVPNTQILDVYYDTADSSPPTPNPPTWSQVPWNNPYYTSIIGMTANTVSDSQCGPVQYYFDETSGHAGGTDSGWQSSASYTDSGLSENTEYTYRVKSRDVALNEGAYSSSSSDYTTLFPPTDGEIHWTGRTATTLSVSVDNPPNWAADLTGSYFIVSGPSGYGGADSGWQTGDYTYTDTTLSENTHYRYRVKYRNGDGEESSCCNYLPVNYTLCSAPSDIEFGAVTANSMQVRVDAPPWPTTMQTGVYFECTAGGAPDSGWLDEGEGYWNSWYYYNLTGLNPDTTYTFRVKLRNQIGVETAYSASESQATHDYVTTESASNVEITSAQLNCEVYSADGNVGFWYGDDPVDDGSFDHNVTVGSYSDHADISKSITVNHSTYYYYLAWSNVNGTFYTGDQKYFLTNPTGPPTDITVTDIGYSYINISWSNITTNVVNQTTVIRHSTVSYPSWNCGTLTYYGTAEYYNWTSASSNTLYYFSLWTYINSSGSPLLWAHSDFDTAYGNTRSGLYNISIRWENVTYDYINLGLDTPEDFTTQHIFTVHYGIGEGAREFNHFEEGSNWFLTQSNDFTDADSSDGWWTINITEAPKWVEFEWSNSDERWGWNLFTQDYVCRRKIVLEPDQQNVTFYIRTDLHFTPSFLSGILDIVNATALVEYNYHFIDDNGEFSLENHPYAYIYKYDQDGNRMIIHSEYFDKNMMIHPSLVLGDTYYLGVKSDTETLDFIGTAPVGLSSTIDIIIPKDVPVQYIFFDLADVSLGWFDTGLYVNYTDMSDNILSVDISFYNSTGSLIHQENTTLKSTNFSFSEAEGCNTSQVWYILINATTSTYQVSSGYLKLNPDISYSIVDATDINTIMTLMFGPTPVQTSEGVGVSYAYLGVLILAILGLLSFKPDAAHIGLFVEGAIFMLCAGAISGMNELFADYSWQQGAILGSIGLFLIILGILSSMAGKRKQEDES